MNQLKLVTYKINEYNFKLKEQPKTPVKYQITPKIECKMGKNGNNIFVNMTMSIGEKAEEVVPFGLKAVMFGHFTKEEGNELTDKELVNEAMNTLYPILRSTIASLTLNCNIPAYILPLMQGNTPTAEPTQLN